MKNWYVVQTKPQKESNVQRLFEEGGYESFLPKIKTFLRSRRKGIENFGDRIKPLFPSYLFVRLEPLSANEFRTVKFTRGVNKIVGSPEGPIPIQEEVVAVIRERVGAKGFIEQGAFLKTNDKVVVKRGVLKDLIGVLEKPMDDKGRVEILFKIVKVQMRAKVFCGDLEKVH